MTLRLLLVFIVTIFFVPVASARTVESSIEDVTWDLWLVARPSETEDDIPTQTVLLMTDGVYPPSLALTSFRRCKLNREALKVIETELRKHIGEHITTTVDPNTPPQWFGEGYTSTFLFGDHSFESGKTVKDVMLETGGAVTDPNDAPAIWWKKPECMDTRN